MHRSLIPDKETLRREIQASHQRCRHLGINPAQIRNPTQKRLTPEELQTRRRHHKSFLGIAAKQIEDLYQFVAGAGFAVTLADAEGYILHMIGDQSTLRKLAASNCAPGFRWTEKDVGTTVISLVVERWIPVQINDEEHYCKRGHGHTCSAAPVFAPDNTLLGLIALTGEASQVHPHTLGMVITAAKAIENQLRIHETSQALRLQNKYMSALIDSIDMGVLAVDREGRIRQINDRGKRILNWDVPLIDQSLTAVFGDQLDIERLMGPESEFSDREVFLHNGHRSVQLLCTAKPIFDSSHAIQGILVVFSEINRIRRLVNEMAGSHARFTFEDIIGTSAAILETKNLAKIAALGQSTVLLLGETGTGKELFAQAIHNHSGRKDRPFLVINCGAIPRELLESELFGYVEGAFTGAVKGGRPGKFELASRGTILLDEIGDMPTDMQVKLLRVLQTGEIYRIGSPKSIAVDVRIIAATNAPLRDHVEKGSFRKDLYYRLNVLPITIPPLRERREDIIPLARHILQRCSHALKKPDMWFSAQAEQVLHTYAWPGNIRELENVVERAVNLATGPEIEAEDLGLAGSQVPEMVDTQRTSHLKEIEKQVIQQAIEKHRHNLAETAKSLGIARATLYNKIKRYRLSVERPKRSFPP